MLYHIIRFIMAAIGVGLMYAIAHTAATGETNGYFIAYLLYAIFFMCTYPFIGRYYGIISLWSSIPGASVVFWVLLTILLIVASIIVIPCSLVYHFFGAIIRMFK